MPIGTPDPSHAMRCGGCQLLVADGCSFCPGCGFALAQGHESQSDLACPSCGDEAPAMTRWGLAPDHAHVRGYEVDGCTHCGGAWVAKATLDALVAEASQFAARSEVPEREVRRRVMSERPAEIRYRRCPVCAEMMARKNFARVSGIILDSCLDHGSYFDAGELQDVLDFVRSGGLVFAQSKLAAEDARMVAAEASAKGGPGVPMGYGNELMLNHRQGLGDDLWTRPIGVLAWALVSWGARWTVRLGRRVVDSIRD